MAHFRARARAVDMLGRQQIAGIPTAISELFKNAHDAYADHAVADYFRKERLFVLRDDGIGMSEEDFNDRWLMIGTEGKVQARGRPQQTRPNYRRRPVLGEKGIGRLAIAAIGPQVLVLTRPLEGDGVGNLVVALLNWSVFELQTAELGQIEIPTAILPGGTLPSDRDLADLVSRIRENVNEVKGAGDAATVKRINAELDELKGLSVLSYEHSLSTPSLRDASGTQFYIQPTSSNLAADLTEVTEPTVEAAPLLKTLLGFSNTMAPGHSKPALETEFRDHWSDDAWSDLIAESAFFTPAEFEAADHHFHGSFDDFGQFEGRVSVFGDEPVPWNLAWPNAHGEPTACGPFEIHIAYVQGKRSQSRLDPEEWSEIVAKLERYSGLYIYRDGIRVLPYGNSDFDFLDLERRRSKSASDYFFSYRRMFGVIELTSNRNHDLREKAGREGFATNEAYRQFRDILKRFFYQVAFDFFREEGTLSDDYHERREELERIDKARSRRGRQVRERRRVLSRSLSEFFERVGREQPEEEVGVVLERLRGDLAVAAEANGEGAAATALADAESRSRAELAETIERYSIRRPRGVGLTRDLTREWRGYELEIDRLQEAVFRPAEVEIEELLEAAQSEQEAALARRVRFDRAIKLIADSSIDRASSERRRLSGAAKAATERSRELGKASLRTVEEQAQLILSEAATTDVTALDDRQFVETRSELEGRVAAVTSAQLQALGSVAEQLEELVWPENGRGPLVTRLDEVEALESDLEGFRERSEQDLEFTQLGMAVEVINHEFQATVRGIRSNIQRLTNWAAENPGLRAPVRDLRSSFEHLDSYLNLFTPLNRRLYRKKTTIKGGEITAFLEDVFKRRLEEEGVALEASRAFTQHKLVQYPSTIYPVFVSLVDNALYWLGDFQGPRTITLDVDRGDLVVRDTGPGVAVRDQDAIFERGFSRKPGGTGYGLSVSREVLDREGMDLLLDAPSADSGAVFRIRQRGDRED
jgi:signal transduction histidine kinase